MVAARPADAIPPDLDLVARIDLGTMRSALGELGQGEVLARTLVNDAGTDVGTDRFLLAALARTETLWIAGRPGNSLESSDLVLVLRGQFDGLDAARAGSEPAWHSALDLGRDWRSYDRLQPKQRSAPARIYAEGDTLLVLVSAAEIDSVERSLNGAAVSPPLEPRESGLISAAARVRALHSDVLLRSDTLRRLFEGAQRVDGTLDVTSAGFELRLALQFEEEIAAARAAKEARELADALRSAPGLIGKLASALGLSQIGSELSFRLVLGREEFTELVRCAGGECAK
jgi:hypothetical protein